MSIQLPSYPYFLGNTPPRPAFGGTPPRFGHAHQRPRGLARKTTNAVHVALHVVLGGIAALTLFFPHHDAHQAAHHHETGHEEPELEAHGPEEASTPDKIRDGLQGLDMYFHLGVLALIGYDGLAHLQARKKRKQGQSLEQLSGQLAAQGLQLDVALDSPLLSGKPVKPETLSAVNKVLTTAGLRLQEEEALGVRLKADTLPGDNPFAGLASLDAQAEALLGELGIRIRKTD